MACLLQAWLSSPYRTAKATTSCGRTAGPSWDTGCPFSWMTHSRSRSNLTTLDSEMEPVTGAALATEEEWETVEEDLDLMWKPQTTWFPVWGMYLWSAHCILIKLLLSCSRCSLWLVPIHVWSLQRLHARYGKWYGRQWRHGRKPEQWWRSNEETRRSKWLILFLPAREKLSPFWRNCAVYFKNFMIRDWDPALPLFGYYAWGNKESKPCFVNVYGLASWHVLSF